jgi:hypothetical protein
MDGVEPDDFTGKVEPQYLFLAFVINDIALEAPGANRGYGPEFISGSEQVLTGLDGPGAVNDLLETFGFVRGQSSWQAQLSERTSAACDL